jgi:uncharacterized protein (DUF983 family)
MMNLTLTPAEADAFYGTRVPCPDCPDGHTWDSYGPTGKVCETCKGEAYVIAAPRTEESADGAP